MIEIILAVLTVWTTPDGSPVYVAHCRNSPDGCRARVTEQVGWARDAAERHGIEVSLLLAIGLRESGMNPDAVGTSGEVGIYQLHPRGAGARAKRMCREGAYPWGYCVAYVAAQVLAEGISTCGTVPLALGYYNTGRCLTGRYSRAVLTGQARL